MKNLICNILSILKLDTKEVIIIYNQYTYRFHDSNEIGYSYKGNYGAKGEKRAPRKKATPEQVAKQNQINRINKVRRLIKANFYTRDYWVTLKYPKGARPKLKTVKKDFDAFIRRMRSKYKKYSHELKYIYRMEIGKKGGVHIHILVNRISGNINTDLIIRECWKPSGGGSINYQLLYETGGFADLAEYIVKVPQEEQMEQLSLFDEDEKKKLCTYNHSRNLIIPKPEKKTYSRRTMRKILLDGPKPSDGYYIDKSSIRSGVNQYTGMSYLYYTEILVKKDKAAEGG